MRHSLKQSLKYVCLRYSTVRCTNFSCKRFHTASSSLDVETLGHISRVLSANETALDLISLHVELSALVSSALAFVEEYDCEAVGTLRNLLKSGCNMAPR